MKSTLLLFTWCIWGVYLIAQTYPEVGPLQRTVEVPDVGKANVSVDIRSVDGTPLYRLQCHSAGYTGDPDFDYSGDFECRLSSISDHDTYSTLLTEDAHQSRDWESRGRFFSADLRGACAHIAEFGANRTFKLRGMILTLQITDPKFTDIDKLRSLKLTVTVRPDPDAQRPIAEAVPLPTGSPTECKLAGGPAYHLEGAPPKLRLLGWGFSSPITDSLIPPGVPHIRGFRMCGRLLIGLHRHVQLRPGFHLFRNASKSSGASERAFSNSPPCWL